MKLVDFAAKSTQCTICSKEGRLIFNKFNRVLDESWYCPDCSMHCGACWDFNSVKVEIDVIRTSYFARSSKLPNAISIARGYPASFKGRQYLKLAPSKDLLDEYKRGKLSEEEYAVVFGWQLDELDPVEVVKELGPNPILLCWEGPSKFCHRHLVADWLLKAGFAVSEVA
ncbi:MAG: hypothetical protein NTV25_03335 [Methanothrix sp.]|nr:hypothetical protein [Methanothrix sp.]